MHIIRIVTHISNGSQTLVYCLNGFRVFINRDTKDVNVERRDLFATCDAELCKLVGTIGMNDRGNIKINPANKNIQEFLKVTKCLK